MRDHRGMRIWGHHIVEITAALFLAALRTYAGPGACDKKLSYYDGYKVIKVQIKNPIGFITPWSSLSKTLKKGLKIKVDDSFSSQRFEQDSDYLNARLKAEFASSYQKVKLAYAGGELEDCDPETRTLSVVYPIFTTVLPSLIPPSIEQQTNESNRPATTGAVRASDSPVQVMPITGYNQTRGIFGGLSFSDTAGSLKIHGETEDSGNSRFGHLGLSSQLGPASRFWNDAEWAITFVYQDTPAGAARFKEGKLTARFSAYTSETPKKHLIFRYGAALEGGHQQSSNTEADAKLMLDSAYGSLKLYAGLTGRPGNAAFAASYGLQLGTTLTSGPVFKKHLVDLGYNINLPVPFRKPMGDREDFKGPLGPGVHRSLGLETRFAAGLIQDVAGAPLGERFLGGNEVRPFVLDDSWVIQSDAFIRSIPQNQLSTQSGNQLGGSRFYSANATVSYTLWGRPFLPKELVTAGTNFPEVLNPGFQTAATALANHYKTSDPEYIRLTAEVPTQATDLGTNLTALSSMLKTIPLPTATRATTAKLLKDIRRNLVSTRGAASLVSAAADPQVMDQLATNLIPALSGLTTDLTRSLRQASQANLANQIDMLMNSITTLGQEINKTNNLPSSKYDDQAWEKLAPGHRAIDVFLHQLNIYSISPVAFFDVARIWPADRGVIYGVGPGLRLSLVNANFTFGYAFNPQRTGQEKPGAIFFKLDITNLF